MAHMTVEVFPEARVFAQGTIATTWHVTQDAIELEVFPVAALLHIGEFARVIVRDH